MTQMRMKPPTHCSYCGQPLAGEDSCEQPWSPETAAHRIWMTGCVYEANWESGWHLRCGEPPPTPEQVAMAWAEAHAEWQAELAWELKQHQEEAKRELELHKQMFPGVPPK